MTVSTDAILCYGISVPEGDELPWSDRELYDDGIHDWWLEQNAWKPSCQPWDEDGERIPNTTEDDVKQYFAEKREFKSTHPCPVDDVIHCSYDYPMHIIAIPTTVKRAWRGFPQLIDFDQCKVYRDDTEALREFCTKYSIQGDEGWWLVSMWG